MFSNVRKMEKTFPPLISTLKIDESDITALQRDVATSVRSKQGGSCHSVLSSQNFSSCLKKNTSVFFK